MSPPELVVPRLLRVQLTEVLVAPVKSNGKTWDVGKGQTEEATRAIDQFASVAAASGEPVSIAVKGVIAVLPSIAEGTAWPDVFGTAHMSPAIDDDPDRRIAAHGEDSVNPQLFTAEGRRPLSWTVQPENRPTLSVKLHDRDAVHDDNIGVFVLSHEMFVEAWRAKKKLWVRVDDQTNQQVLAVGIIAEEVR